MVYQETLVDAVIREVLEETGLVVHPKQVVHVGHRLVAPFWVTVVTYLCDEPSDAVLLSGEHIAYDWVPVPLSGDRPMTPETLDFRCTTRPGVGLNASASPTDPLK